MSDQIDPHDYKEATSAETDSSGPVGSTDSTLHEARAKKTTRPYWIAGIGVVAVAALAFGGWQLFGARGAANAADSIDEAEIATEAASAETGPSTVVVSLNLEPSNLDIRSTSGVALDQILIDNVYEGLLKRNPDNTITESLAKEWEVSDDALTYTFEIAPAAKFASGAPVDAAAAKKSIEEVKDGELVDSQFLSSVEAIEADGQTLTIKLSQPNPDLPWALSGRAGLVLDPTATNDLQTTAEASGPYRVAEWKQGDSITLEKTSDYWGEPVAVDTIVFRYIVDANAGVNALQAGDVDVLAPIDVELATTLSADDFTLVENDASDKWVLAFNNAEPPLDVLEVRQAIRYAIDNEAIVEARGGIDGPLGGPIAPGDPGYEDLSDLYPRDLEKAKRLLADAGYADGLELELSVPSFYPSTIPDLVTAQLAEAGITVIVKPLEFPAWLEDVHGNHNYQLSLVDHAESRDFGSWADPEYYFGYDNAEVQDLYAKAQVATSEDEAHELLAKAARIVSEEAGAEWISNFRTLTAVSNSVQGFPESNVNSRLDLTGLTITEG